MRTVALIPIKTNNERLPGKNTIKFFDGTPLMTFIQNICLQSDRIDEIYIYCSDESINEYILPGVRFLKRPELLDGDSINANDIIREFLKCINADIYVNTHTTSPFASVRTIEKCINKVASGEYDSAFCAESIKAFMWGEGKPLNFSPDCFPRTQDLPKIYAETSIAYVFTKETFITHNRRIGTNPYICEVGKLEAMDVDYPEDFDIANAIYKEILS